MERVTGSPQYHLMHDDSDTEVQRPPVTLVDFDPLVELSTTEKAIKIAWIAAPILGLGGIIATQFTLVHPSCNIKSDISYHSNDINEDCPAKMIFVTSLSILSIWALSTCAYYTCRKPQPSSYI